MDCKECRRRAFPHRPGMDGCRGEEGARSNPQVSRGATEQKCSPEMGNSEKHTGRGKDGWQTRGVGHPWDTPVEVSGKKLEIKV